MAVNPFRYYETVRQQDNRHASAGCLLALVLLLPLAAKSWHPVLLLGFVLLYVIIIVPILVGFFSPIAFFRYLRRIADSNQVGSWIQDFVFQLWIFFGFLHFFYREMDFIHISVTQILFSILCERVFCPSERLCSLIFLSFYNIVAYIVKALTQRRWSQLRLYDHDAGNVFRQAATYMVARMNKGVASLSVLLTISYQAHRLEPSLSFIVASSLFYLLTHLQTSEMMTQLCQKYEFEVLEGLEEWYFPLVLRSLCILSSCGLLATLLLQQPLGVFNLFLASLVLYNNVVVALHRLDVTCLAPLRHQRALTEAFAIATPQQLLDKGDSCPVCLQEGITRARVTPCGHIFHGSCLRKWLQQSHKCPLCMRNLNF
ncbi:hypothetical protein B566_EDAN005936 [Ephemera danica]|nr:hypothetical protein B566_EDAN005936 [Ephemera danica]